ncbi:MAG: metallophosphoesterase, partial [Hyphomicrobium sp.]
MDSSSKSRVISRRGLLGTLGAFGVTAGLSRGEAADDTAHIKLRLLETSDLHMFVLDWDYYHVKADPSVGFAKVATLIRAARAESVNTLLFDNGDFLQGNPLADYVAEKAPPSAAILHPIVAIMGKLGYDAVGLGNHEFNYGLEFLETSLAGAAFPFICANVVRAGGGVFLPPHAILERRVMDTSGAEQMLRIGVIGFVPPQIMTWDKARP